MYSILLILTVVIIYYCGDYISDGIKDWWKDSPLRKWAHPTIAVVLTVAVALGIHFDVLNWGAVAIPVLVGLPYIIGMISGIWHNMKGAGLKVTSKEQIDAREIAVRCLAELGCQPEIHKDGSVGVSYQGENFHLEFGGRYARIWDPMWAGIKGDDPDMPKIKEAVNVTNFDFGPTVVMTAPDENGDIGLHSRREIMLHPSCPDNVPFIKAVLDSFFETKEHVRRHFQQINSQQQQGKTPRRPVGFTTNTTAE